REAELESLKTSWQETLSSLNEIEERLRSIQRQSGELLAELHRVDLQINRLKINEENAIFKLIESYGENWKQEANENLVLPSNPKQVIIKLKRQMKEMEPVNLQAINEHQVLKDRVDFLSKQNLDLIEARESLGKA